MGLVVAGMAIGLFLPAARFGFVNWDDDAYFIDNDSFRGLSWENIAWCFTTTHMGHYQPLNWLSYAIDFAAFGLRPGRFHLSQAILHGIAAVLFFALSKRLLGISTSTRSRRHLTFSAAVAALLFALHPLRVESVVWLSARADILATAFYLAALLCYLKAAHASPTRPLSTGPMMAVLFFFICAVLSKEMAVTLPAILVLLDVYPLGRLPANPAGWGLPNARAILLEKVPFFAIALIATINAFFAAGEGLAGFATHPFAQRLAQAPVSLMFYPFKTVAPTALSPFYEYPLQFGWRHPAVWLSLAALMISSITCWLLRKRFPALAAAAVGYVILISPVVGLTQRGPQMTADRYSYLSCLPWAVLAAGLLALGGSRQKRMTAIAALAVLAAMIYGTLRQQRYWADSVALWEHALRLDPANGIACANVGQAYESRGRHEEAIQAYKKALKLRPHHPNVQRNLAGVYNRLYRNDEAIAAYLADLADNPDRLESHYYLAITYERIGDDEKAVVHYREAARIDARYADAHVALARLFMKHGYLAEAEPRLRRALELDPHHLEALERLARLCGRTRRPDEAGTLLRRAVEEAEHRGERELTDRLRKAHHEITGLAASRRATSE